jgi:hypothetical protein
MDNYFRRSFGITVSVIKEKRSLGKDKKTLVKNKNASFDFSN